MPFKDAASRRESYRRMKELRSLDDCVRLKAQAVTATKKYRSKFTPAQRADMQRDAHLKRYYGMTLQEEQSLFESQGRACALCKCREVKGRNLHWCVDHDHQTGKVRGVLRSNCNTMLGMGGDSPDTLEAGALYLRQHAS